MGYHLHPKAKVGRFPVSEAISFLKMAEKDHGSDGENDRLIHLEERYDFDMANALCAAGIGERDPIEPHFRFGKSGRALARASLMRRLPLAEARVIFAAKLDEILELNRTSLIRLTDICLFGSFGEELPMVGDFDMVVNWGYSPETMPQSDADELSIAQRLDSELRASRGSAQDMRGDELSRWIQRRLMPNVAAEWIQYRFFADANKNRFSVDTDDMELRMLRAPCRMIQIGATTAVAGPMLDRHPRADEGDFRAPVASLKTDLGIFRTRRLARSDLLAAIRHEIGAIPPGAGISPASVGTVFRDMELHFAGGAAFDDPLAALWRQDIRHWANAERSGHGLHMTAALSDLLAEMPDDEPECERPRETEPSDLAF